jgi:hypothetical protein
LQGDVEALRVVQELLKFEIRDIVATLLVDIGEEVSGDVSSV